MIFTFHKQPHLTLVGAGPGDPELLTLKAINTLKTADIVLYDALVGEKILAFIPENIPSLPVGKRAGAHSYSQNDINELIVEFAYLYGHVVRLKGGDPFVFGRATEEIEFAARNGIETSIVPGISSAIAAPGSIGIPLTARGESESFWVVTGTTMAGAISRDISLAAQSSATVIILMGLNKVSEIMQVFASQGKENMAVAIVENATLGMQRSVVGTVGTIATIAKAENISSPAVIVVGEVVKYAREVEKMIARHIGRG